MPLATPSLTVRDKLVLFGFMRVFWGSVLFVLIYGLWIGAWTAYVLLAVLVLGFGYNFLRSQAYEEIVT